jgi:hypothetical protein
MGSEAMRVYFRMVGVLSIDEASLLEIQGVARVGSWDNG